MKKTKSIDPLCFTCKYAIFRECKGTDEHYIYLGKCLKDKSATSWGMNKCEFYSKGEAKFL